MQYLLMIYDDEQLFHALPPDELRAIYARYNAYTAELRAAGVYVAGAPLQPTHTATTVRARDGRTTTTDGPFAETKEQLGGYYLVEVADLDEALRWAAKIPSAELGSIEVRPLSNVG